MKPGRVSEIDRAIGNPSEDSQNFILAINIILVFLGLLYLLASFNPQWRLWGGDFLTAFPVWLRLLLFGLLLLSSLPAVSRRLAVFLSNTFADITEFQAMVLYFFAAAILMALFVMFSSQNHLLGDGYIIQSTIAEGKRFSATEPLEYFIHHLLFLALGGEGLKESHLAYALISYLAGAAFFLILFRFTKGGARPFLALAIAPSFAAMQFFFGYVENYTISFVFTFLYLLSGWKDFEARRLSPLSVTALILAIGFHLNGAVFLPSLVVLIWNRNRTPGPLIISSAAIALFAVLGALYLNKFTALKLGEIFVPLFPTLKNPYSLLSLNHLHDLLNILLLDFPLLLIIPLLARGAGTGPGPFLVTAILPALAFTMIIDPRIGAVRDWDLLSLPTAPLMVCLMLLLSVWHKKDKAAGYALALPVLLLAFMHTGSWVYMNTQRQESYAWMKQIIGHDMHYSKEYFEGYRNKSWAILIKQKYRDLAEATRACEIRYQAMPDDASNTVMLANNYMAMDDTVRAAEIILRYPPESYDGENILAGAGLIMMVTGHYSEAEIIYDKFIARGYSSWAIYFNLGICKELKGQRDLAYELYSKSYELGVGAPLSQELEFYIRCRKFGYNGLFERGIERLASRLPEEIRPIVPEILLKLKTGEAAAVDSLVDDLKLRVAR